MAKRPAPFQLGIEVLRDMTIYPLPTYEFEGKEYVPLEYVEQLQADAKKALGLLTGQETP